MAECWSEKAKNGSSILYIKKEEKVWRLNSPYAPEQEAKRWAEQYAITDVETPVCIFGLGSGYFVQALLKKAREDTIFIIVEPDSQIYESVKDEAQIKAIVEDKRIHLLVGMNQEVLMTLHYQYVDWKNINSSIHCVHPHYEEIYQEEYFDYLKTIRDCQMQEDVLAATTVHHGTRRAENMLKAIELLPQHAVLQKLPEDLAKQIPVIIVAAGPSLEQNVEELQKAKGKAVIIAVDRAFVMLQQHGIRPDLLITLDPVKKPKHVQEAGEIPLLCSFASNRVTLEQYQGKLIFYGSSGYVGQVLKLIDRKVPGVDRGGSVATAAFSVCRALGIKNVILVGQDLAYKDGKSYAGGSGKKKVKHYKVEDIDGNEIETRSDWYIFLKWFEQTIQENPWMHVIDATEGGAKIEGTELRKLSELLEELPDMPISAKEVIEKMQYQISEKEYQTILEKPKADILELKEIEQQARAAEELLDQLLRACRNKSIDDPKYAKQIRKLGEINEKIEQYGVMSFLDYYAGGESQTILTGIYHVDENELSDKEKTYKQAKNFYEMYEQSSKKLIGEMQKLFLEEEKEA